MANVEAAREHLTALRALFVARYNLRAGEESPGLTAIDEAIAAGADADIAGLREVMAGYNLYGHHAERARVELRAAERALETIEALPEMESLTKTELLRLAEERGIDVSSRDTVAVIREALSAAEAEELAEAESESEAEPN
jgi:hypothetical protein